MPLTSDYFDHHLVPHGWVHGSSKLDFGGEDVPMPADRVLTVREHRCRSSYQSDEDITLTETWRSPDEAKIKELTEKFGNMPKVQEPFLVPTK